MSDLMIRSGGLVGYRHLVKQLGGNPDALLMQSDIDPAWLEDEDTLIPADGMAKLLELSTSELQCSDFGLRLAKLQTLGMLGPVGLLVQQCSTLGEALVEIKRFIHVHSQAGLVDYEANKDYVFISYQPLVDYQGLNQQLIVLSLAAGFNILNGLSSKALTIKSAHFAFAQPESLSAYHSYFKCPLSFDQETSGVVLPAENLELPLKSNNEQMKSFMNRYLERLNEQSAHSLESRVRILIRQCLPLGNCSITQVSQLLGMDKRTLQRRLKEKALAFQMLLDDERKRLAIRYLKESNVALSHLADLLGFSELSVFSRTFKGWTGLTPTQFLKEETSRLKYR